MRIVPPAMLRHTDHMRPDRGCILLNQSCNLGLSFSGSHGPQLRARDCLHYDTTVRIILAPYNRDMRTAPLLIALFLLAGAAALAYLPSIQTAAASGWGATAGPGAYPLAPRPQYAATIRSAPFQPSKSLGSDKVPPVSAFASTDAKTNCLTECPAIRPATKTAPFS